MFGETIEAHTPGLTEDVEMSNLDPGPGPQGIRGASEKSCLSTPVIVTPTHHHQPTNQP